MLSTGCATIVSKSTYPVMLNSNPSGASVTIKNKSGVAVQNVTTPATVMLKAGDGFFSKANYTLEFEKDGYSPYTTMLTASMDGWYIGNLVFGGLIGFLIVDPATGAMWKLDPIVYGNLAEKPSVMKSEANIERPEEADTAAVTKVASVSTDDVATQLKKLKELKDSGLLTEDEYETRRKALVDQL